MTSPLLFSPISLGPVSLPNRIMVSPMCQYSADDGCANDWHATHLSSLALSGAGVLCIEATAVSPEGRITHGCLGLYSDDNEHALRRVVDQLRGASPVKLMIQLGHAGRKASSARPWEGGQLLTPAEGGWTALAPSALPHKDGEAAPQAMSLTQIDRLIADFVATTRRVRALGFDAIEIHLAHGYLLHQFLSPLANARDDDYGGSLENRMRLALRVFDAVREAAGPDIAVGARLSATDWVDGGWDVEQSIVLARALQARGADFIDVSSAGVSPLQKIAIGPGYQVGFAEQIRRELTIPVITVGLITEPQQAEDILQSGQADMVALARAFIADPRWPWRAAATLGGKLDGFSQYYRCLPSGSPRIFGDVVTNQR
jgi:2,4-dienoyl-CoA reductase-like NADH-dependent reductase (Old Yellow Enzyme family)